LGSNPSGPQGEVDFEEIFAKLYPSLFRYLNRLTGDPDVAADISQEAFVRLLQRPLPEADARRWLFTVATNLVRDWARAGERQRRLLRDSYRGPARPDRPDESAERSLRIAAVRAALAQISPRDKEILLMGEEGFRYAEIAEVVGVAPGSVGTLLARALRRFAAVYGEQAAGESPTGTDENLNE
jgi:RNA polymerase sigma-70 factor (ECF subfamily)